MTDYDIAYLEVELRGRFIFILRGKRVNDKLDIEFIPLFFLTYLAVQTKNLGIGYLYLTVLDEMPQMYSGSDCLDRNTFSAFGSVDVYVIECELVERRELHLSYLYLGIEEFRQFLFRPRTN